MTSIRTTLGPKSSSELGLILPHEHVFVDLRTWDTPGYAQAEAEDVIRLMAPEIRRAQAAGVTAIVECSTVGVGRRADIERAVSRGDRSAAGGADRDLPRTVGAGLGARGERGSAGGVDAGRTARVKSKTAACRRGGSS